MGTGTAFPWILGVIAHGQSGRQAVESAVAQKCSEWDGDTAQSTRCSCKAAQV